MEKKADYFLIVNPVSGRRRAKAIAEAVTPAIGRHAGRFEVHTTTRAGDATGLSRQAVAAGFHVVVVIGGDGTVNEAVTGMAGGEAALGVIPTGSGNGLALELGMSLRPMTALRQILSGKDLSMDLGRVGDRFFTCTCGFAFEAHIAQAMQRHRRRGGWRYLVLAMKEALFYRPVTFQFEVEGRTRRCRALLFTIANGRQFGNRAKIAPQAAITDGRLDAVIWRPFPKWGYPLAGAALYTGTSHRLPFCETLRSGRIRLMACTGSACHVDGEPFAIDRLPLDIWCEPGALRVRVPR